MTETELREMILRLAPKLDKYKDSCDLPVLIWDCAVILFVEGYDLSTQVCEAEEIRRQIIYAAKNGKFDLTELVVSSN